MASTASRRNTLPDDYAPVVKNAKGKRRTATMKNRKNTVPLRVACYVRARNKEQLSPEERKAMFQDEFDAKLQEVIKERTSYSRRNTLKHTAP